MTRLTATDGSQGFAGKNDRFSLLRAGAAAAGLAASAAAATAGIGGGAAAAVFTALVALAGMATGHLFGRTGDPAAKAARLLMLRVADELIQYRAFTRLLRDQGGRVVESTSAAATVIIAGLAEMDAALSRMRVLVHRTASDDAKEMRSLVDAIGAPVLGMLGQLQFQDVTQQQIDFLSRLSLILDDHMVQLACRLGDHRVSERIARFREMFDQALDDCVMDGQRDDHHAASGLAQREDVSPKLELF
jgi:hypothetical protein